MKSTMVKLATVGVVAIMAAGSMAFVTGEKQEASKGGQPEQQTEWRGGCRGKKSCGVGGEDRMLKRLDLTAEQKSRIESIRTSFKTENATALALMESLHQRMREARIGGDQGQMEALHQEMRAAKDALRPASRQINEQIRSVLTPEQVAKLDRRGRGGCRGDRQKEQPQTTLPQTPSTVTPGIE